MLVLPLRMCLGGRKPLWPIPHKDRRAPDTEKAPRGCGPDTRRSEGKGREGSWGCTEGPASAHWAVGRRALLLRPRCPRCGHATVCPAGRAAGFQAGDCEQRLPLSPSVRPCALTSAAPPGGPMGVTGSRTTPTPQRSFPLGTISPHSAIHSVVCGLWCISLISTEAEHVSCSLATCIANISSSFLLSAEAQSSRSEPFLAGVLQVSHCGFSFTLNVS